MRVTIFGSGYVGLVTGACLAEAGNHVVCVDVNRDRIARLQADALEMRRTRQIVVIEIAGSRDQDGTRSGAMSAWHEQANPVATG